MYSTSGQLYCATKAAQLATRIAHLAKCGMLGKIDQMRRAFASTWTLQNILSALE